MRRWIALVPLILGVGLISVLLDDKISSHEYPDFQCNVNLLCCISWVVVAGLIWRGLAIRRAAALMLASLAVTSLITASTYLGREPWSFTLYRAGVLGVPALLGSRLLWGSQRGHK